MKALLDSAVRALSSALLVVVANGCWTADARDRDAGSIDANALCEFAPNACFEPVKLDTAPLLVDLAQNTTIQTTPGLGGASFNTFPGPDVDAGNLNGLSRLNVPSDPDYPFHLKGNVPAAAGWNINWYFNDIYCGDAFDTKKGPVIDASDYEGVSIQLFGNPGPTGQMKFKVDSVGTPEDPTRQQRLQTVINVPSTPTTFAFKWSDLAVPCGNRDDFKPGTIIGFAGEFRALAGITYDLDVVIGKIGFIPKSQ
jgi:hypothetical protein